MTEQTRTYTLTRALTRIKTLSIQIEELQNIREDSLLGTIQETRKDDVAVKQFLENSKAKWDQYNDLINERNAMRDAVRRANDKVTVTLGGETLTITQVLNRKDGLKEHFDFLARLIRRNEAVNENVLRSEEQVEKEARSQLSAVVKPDAAPDVQAQEALLNTFRESVRKEKKLVRLSGISEKELKDHFEKVKMMIEEMDYVLSEANATNTVTLD